MDTTVLGLAAGNIVSGLAIGLFFFAVFTALMRAGLISLVFDTGAGASLGALPALALIGMGFMAFQSYQPPALDWAIRAAIVFLPPAILAVVSLYPFGQIYDDAGAHRRYSPGAMSASVGLVYGGSVPAGLTLLNMQDGQVDELANLPIF